MPQYFRGKKEWQGINRRVTQRNGELMRGNVIFLVVRIASEMWKVVLTPTVLVTISWQRINVTIIFCVFAKGNSALPQSLVKMLYALKYVVMMMVMHSGLSWVVSIWIIATPKTFSKNTTLNYCATFPQRCPKQLMI